MKLAIPVPRRATDSVPHPASRTVSMAAAMRLRPLTPAPPDGTRTGHRPGDIGSADSSVPVVATRPPYDGRTRLASENGRRKNIVPHPTTGIKWRDQGKAPNNRTQHVN